MLLVLSLVVGFIVDVGFIIVVGCWLLLAVGCWLLVDVVVAVGAVDAVDVGFIVVGCWFHCCWFV